MLKLRKKEIIIWLDNDMRDTMLKYQAQMSQFKIGSRVILSGNNDMRDTMLKYQAQMSQFKIGSRVILSGKDPKGYNDLAIRQLSAGGIGRAL
jgi:CRISPR/Cas system-associated protein endoribonuclease Cas2